METKITHNESKLICESYETIKAIHLNLCYEWRRDLNKNGYVKLHSKLYKAMKYSKDALNYMAKMYEHLEFE